MSWRPRPSIGISQAEILKTDITNLQLQSSLCRKYARLVPSTTTKLIHPALILATVYSYAGPASRSMHLGVADSPR